MSFLSGRAPLGSVAALHLRAVLMMTGEKGAVIVTIFFVAHGGSRGKSEIGNKIQKPWHISVGNGDLQPVEVAPLAAANTVAAGTWIVPMRRHLGQEFWESEAPAESPAVERQSSPAIDLVDSTEPQPAISSPPRLGGSLALPVAGQLE